MRIVGVVDGEGFRCEIVEDDDGRVHYVANADIDADGANGQNGAPAAYRDDDTGSDYLENAGMKIVAGKVVCAKSWARNVVILGADREPRVFPGGLIASMTTYRHRHLADDDPAAYVDAETVPYVAVPPLVVNGVRPVVMGCLARVAWRGRSVDCVVADTGPPLKVGEISIAAARALGIPPSPRNGGRDVPDVAYELWPGTPAPGYELQPAG